MAKWLVAHGARVNTVVSELDYSPLCISVTRACESTDPRYTRLVEWLASQPHVQVDARMPKTNITPLCVNSTHAPPGTHPPPATRHAMAR